jgi:hypothetical protein
MDNKIDPITGEPMENEENKADNATGEQLDNNQTQEPMEDSITEEPKSDSISEEPMGDSITEESNSDSISEETKSDSLIEEPRSTQTEENIPEILTDDSKRKEEPEDSNFDLMEEMSTKKGKSKVAGRGIGIAVAAILLCIILAVTVVKADLFQNKNDLMNKAFTNLFTADKNSTMNSIFDFEKFAKDAMKSGVISGGKLKLESFETMAPIEGATISYDSAVDYKNHKLNFALGAAMGDKELLNADIYMEKENFAVKIPQILDQVFVLGLSGNLKENMNKSVLKDYLSESEINGFADYIETYSNTIDIAQPSQIQYVKSLNEAKNTLFDKMVIKKIDSKNFDINNKSKKLKGYEVTVSKDALIPFIEQTGKSTLDYLNKLYSTTPGDENSVADMKATYQEGLDQLISMSKENLQDVEMTVYLYKDEIAYLKATTTVNGHNIDLELQFNGGKSIKDNMTGKLTVDMGEADVLINLNRKTTETDTDYTSTWEGSVNGVKATLESKYNKSSKDFNINFSTLNETGMNIAGTLKDVESGKSCTVNINELSITSSGYNVATLSGNFYWNILSDSVNMPSGDKIDLLTISKTDFEGVLAKIQENAYTLQNELAGLFY